MKAIQSTKLNEGFKLHNYARIQITSLEKSTHPEVEANIMRRKYPNHPKLTQEGHLNLYRLSASEM